MAGRINSNVQADFAQRLLGLNQQDQNQALRKISSGLRINSAGDDAAGFAISERLESISRGFEQSERNLQDGASALQIAEGGLSTVNDNLQRIRELSVQAANGTLTDADREIIQGEVDQLVAEIDRSTSATQFNGQELLSGNFDANNPFTIQSGANQGETLDVELAETSTSTLGVAGIDVSTQDAASSALATLDTAISTVNGQQSEIGAVLNRVESATQFVGVARENTLAALSQIRDADLAAQSTELALTQIRTSGGVAALSQANLTPQNVLQLLG